jgi:hypothetical protein
MFLILKEDHRLKVLEVRVLRMELVISDKRYGVGIFLLLPLGAYGICETLRFSSVS